MAKLKGKQNYELLFIISPTLGDEEKENLLTRVRGYLDLAESQVFTFKSWGMRRLAYTLKGQKEGEYYLVQYAMATEKVTEFRRSLILAEGILREMVIRVEDEFPPEKPARSSRPVVIPVFDDDANDGDGILDDDED